MSYCATVVQLFCEVKHGTHCCASIPVSELRTNSNGISSWLEHKIIHAKNHPFVVVGARANLLPRCRSSPVRSVFICVCMSVRNFPSRSWQQVFYLVLEQGMTHLIVRLHHPAMHPSSVWSVGGCRSESWYKIIAD